MSDLLQEYKEYYAVRAKRYANNPNYKNSYEAEKKLSEAIQSCNTLEEFKDKLGNLNHLCGIALIKDRYIMENKMLSEFEEVVRVKASERVLEKIDEYQDIDEAMVFVNETETSNMIDVQLDESNQIFIDCWKQLDEIDIYSNAEVPSEYKSYFMKIVDLVKEIIISSYKDEKELLKNLTEKWEHNPDIIMEHRHKRHLPYKDEHIKEKIAQYKSIINL
ncbi:MAG: hypothetical protein ACOXZH_05800 [Bacteroidales bacterium]|jgi:hypothetical protein|nr:hypothetical protein [Bacteroidales bacterium]